MTKQTTTSKWVTTNLGEICNLLYGKSLPEKNRITGIFPVYGSNGIVGSHNEAFVKSSGIIVGRKGSIGVVCFSESPFCPIDTTFYVTQSESKVDLRFLYYLLKSINLGKLKADVGIPGINREMAYREVISIPNDTKEQKAIARVLTTVQDAIAAQETLIAKLKELKRSMMQYLFTHGTKKGEKTKMTEIGEIPESWNVVEISAAYKFTNKPKKLILTGCIPFVPMEYIQIGKISISDYIEKSAKSITSGTYVERGDLLLAKITPSFENGKQAILKIEHDFAYATTEVIPIKEIKGKSSIMYLFYYLLENGVRQKLVGQMDGTTGRQRLNKSVLGKTFIPFPCYEEQAKIASIFMGIDNKIESIQKKLAVHQNIFKTLITELMSAKRRVI